MEAIVKKRNDLINYFKKDTKEYSKLDILNKEFSVLQFSIREEFIDNFTTPYDNLITDISDIDVDVDEVYIKGIIVDVDNKKDYAILHLQNKQDNVSIICDKPILYHYSSYFEVGNVIIAKCHTYKNRFYMHFMINFAYEDKFGREANYMNGKSALWISQLDYLTLQKPIGLVKQAKYFVSKNGNNCLRLVLNVGGKEGTYISCANKYNTIPTNIIAGQMVEFVMSGNSDTFINRVTEFKI